MNTSRVSASVIAAGIVAILGSCLAILGIALGLIGIALIPSTSAVHQMPAAVRSMTMAMLALFLGVAVFGVFTGVGLIRLKNWARISAMIWAGITAVFGSLILLFTLFMPIPSAPGGQPAAVAVVKVFLFVFYAVPVVIGIWWLILFNRPNIRAQFSGLAPGSSVTEETAKPRCPLPVAVIAGFLVFSFLCVLLVVPLFHFRVPMLLFGHLLRGRFGFGILMLTAVLILIAAMGLWRLKRWSYPLIIGLQAFWLLNGTITFLSPNFGQNMQEILNETQMPVRSATAMDWASQNYLHSVWWMMILGLVPNLLILAILLYYRDAFQKAAAEAETNQGLTNKVL